MTDKGAWDWHSPKKEIPIKEWHNRFNWVEEFHVSPDGEKIAAIVNSDMDEFMVCVNGETWEEPFEKAGSVTFGPDGRLSVLAAKDEQWSVCTDGVCWETWFDFIWDLTVSSDGRFIGTAIQTDMKYGMAVNGTPWDTLYENITGMTLSDRGSSAAIVQVVPLAQADIDGFSAGIFSAVVNGAAGDETFMNAWDPCFDPQGKQIAYSVRLDRNRYSLVQNGTVWPTDFQSVWDPRFYNRGQSVIAPVRINGKWSLFKDGSSLWNRQFDQLWQIRTHEASQKIAAVVSDSYGKWTVCQNNVTWDFHCSRMITDLCHSADGTRLAACCKEADTWDLVVDAVPWHLNADKLWAPVISDDGSVIAARLEKDHAGYLAVNGKVLAKAFDWVFEPAISPDGSKILLKTIKNGIYSRQVLSLDHVL
ncbi:MAG: Tmc redox complex protein TmcD [Desulfobacterales bacterium]|nr:Tmc redox complex protein TmcD [Desulfobacterales bacterium]